jgi:hypothetical protein
VIGQRHGVDLSLVPVDRTVRGAQHARQLGARAFTSEAGVVIPPELGTLDAGPGKALLAHELTHVAQQARLGPGLPPEHTPAGQGLEAEAISAEMALAPLPAIRPASLEPVAGPVRGRQAGPGEDGSRPAPGGPLPLATAPAAGPGHNSDQVTLAGILEQLSALSTTTATGPGQTTIVMPPAAVSSSPAAPPATSGIQRAEQEAPVQPAAAPAPEEPSTLFAERPDDAELNRLARWLYPIISYQLRSELREGRERSGLLTDTYGRW